MPKIRVLLVDDAVVMRKLVSEALSRDPEIQVVGTAANGMIALQKLTQVNPDIIILDVEMPDMDGLATLRELRRTHPRLPVIMFSTLTTKGAETTLDALTAGARDYVAKPANVGSVVECIRQLEDVLLAKIKVHCRHITADTAANEPATRPLRIINGTGEKPGPGRVDVVCIGTSTGGPSALAQVFADFPAPFPVPIFIVQHMPPVFTAVLAQRLSTLGPLKFHEGVEGQRVEAGHAYIAPGGKHMEVRDSGMFKALHLHEEAPENSCRPAADVLFRSVVSAYKKNILGVVMTGMGKDGLRGCELIHDSQGQVVVQDKESSVVWGMPGYVAQAGYANSIVPLREIAGEIVRRTRVGRVAKT